MNSEDKAAIEDVSAYMNLAKNQYAKPLAEQILRVIAIAKRAVAEVAPDEPAKPEFPKWYVREVPTLSYRGKLIAFSRHDADGTGETFHVDGTSYKWHENEPDGWIETTEADALARITPPVPAVESPDDWVEFDKAMIAAPRPLVDQVLSHGSFGKLGWCEVIRIWTPEEWARETYWSIRCRREDLPKPEPEPLTPFQEKMKAIGEKQKDVERVPVRLWILERYLDDKGAAICACVCPPTGEPWREVVSDGKGGWCIEVPK